MIILDCESKESTYYSLEEITGIKVEQIQSIIVGIENPHDLLLQLKQHYRIIDINNVDYTMWFHMSRVFDKSVFNDGILPVKEVYEILRSQIESFINEIDQNLLPPMPISYKNRLHSCCLSIRNRIDNVWLGGPYAVLIKELGFNTVHGKYMNIPETIEDLLIEYSVQLKKIFSQNIRKKQTHA